MHPGNQSQILADIQALRRQTGLLGDRQMDKQCDDHIHRGETQTLCAEFSYQLKSQICGGNKVKNSLRPRAGHVCAGSVLLTQLAVLSHIG